MRNKQISGDRLSAQLVVASDVHLRAIDDPRGTLLMDVLERLSDDVEYVVLNGDIFDFCFGDSAYFREKFHEFGELLRRTAQRGIQVVFIEGNHEFHLDRIGWTQITLVQGDHYEVRLKTGELIKIGHGDLISEEHLYRAFRGTLKSHFTRFLAAQLPGKWLDAYALRHASFSRSQDVYRTIHHKKILDAAERWLGEGPYSHGIIGHFHVPYAEKRQGHSGYILSVESWDRPNLLTFNKGVFERIYLETPGESFIPTPVTSVFLEK